MAQIGTIKLQTPSGPVSVPVFDTADAGNSVFNMLRVQTPSGVGFIPLVDTADASFPYFRVQTENNGIVAVHNTAQLSIFSDSFEDQNISEYSGDTSSFSITSAQAQDGLYSLESTTLGNSFITYQGSGVVSNSEVVIEGYVYSDGSSGARVGFCWFMDAASDNGYCAAYRGSDSSIFLAEVNNQGTSVIVNVDNTTLTPNTWIKMRITHDQGDNINVSYNDGEASIARTGNNSRFSGYQGIFGNGSNDGFIDNWKYDTV